MTESRPSKSQGEDGSSTDALRYLPGLDGARACAFLLVLFWHATDVTGWFGVDLFFVLSGFLISRILLETRGHSRYFLGFYGRRTVRIFPLYYAFLILDPVQTIPREFLPYFFGYATNFLFAQEQRWIQPGHLWSLAVEEQFYLFWPIFIYLIAPRRIATAVAGVCLAGWFAKTCGFLAGVSPLSLYVLPWYRVDAFAWGALVAIGCRHTPRWYRWIASWRHVLTVASLVIFAYGIRIHPFETRHWYWPALGTTNLYILAALALIHILEGPRLASLLEMRPLRALGRISYGLYVWHVSAMTIAYAIIKVVAQRWHFADMGESLLGRICCVLPLAFVLTLVMALLSWQLIERPFLSLKRYMKYQRSEA